MAWNIAGVDRRTRDAAVEAARRAGMRLDDWLDEVITDYAGLDLRARPEPDRAEDDRLDAGGRTSGTDSPDETNGRRRRARPDLQTLSIQ